MKLTRFLIADNPMVEGSPSAIIHTLDPQAIIEITEGKGFRLRKPGETKMFQNFKHVNIDGIEEYYVLSVHHLFTREFDSDQHHIIADKLLNRAWHWFMAYMKWEDEQIE
ncbi:MAG: hypothetical protein ACRC1W_01210 [Shewanella sp.]